MRAQAELDAQALRIRARHDMSTLLAGAYLSAFRGRGLTFEELRDYVPGDDIRWIEWNATARHGRPVVKQMREERDLVLVLLVDLSNSLNYGFADETKRMAACRSAAALAVAAANAQDRVGLATFGSSLIQTLRPARGPLQLERVFEALETSQGGDETRPNTALEWAVDTLPRHSVVIWISDFLFGDPGDVLRRCARKHELCALRVVDPADFPPEDIAPVRVRGLESAGRGLWRHRHTPLRLSDSFLRSLGIQFGVLHSGTQLIPSLHRFLVARGAGS